MFCTQCGNELESDAAFCIMCGAAITSDQEAPTPSAGSHDAGAMWDAQPAGETILFEDDSDAMPADDGPDAWPGAPTPTIVEEPEPVNARLRLEIDDAQVGHRSIEFELDTGRMFVIGRDGHVTDFVPGDPRTSRRHFSIGVGPEGFVVQDLGSSNGTFINGTRVHDPVIVRTGDTIEYGRSRAVLHVLQEPDPWPSGGYDLLTL